MPRTMASRPSDSGLPYFSSIRSASWTISPISPSTGSPRRSYSFRNVSKEQSSPRWESLAPTTSKSSAPSGASAGSRKKAKVACWSRKRWINHMQAVRSTWHPPRVAHNIRPCPRCRGPRATFAVPYGFASGLECPRCLEAQRGSKVVPAPLRPELALQLAELLGQGPAAHLRLAPYALRPRDDGPVGLLPRGTEGPHQLGFLGHSPRLGLPQGRLAPGLPHPQLQPLQLLAGDGVLRECRYPILEVESTEVPELTPHGHPVARGLSWDPVD